MRHGVAVADPYRWLEDGASPETLAWGVEQERYLRASNRGVSDRIADLRRQIEVDLGGWSPLIHRLAGPVLLLSARRDARLFPSGRIREPRTFVERSHWQT